MQAQARFTSTHASDGSLRACTAGVRNALLALWKDYLRRREQRVAALALRQMSDEQLRDIGISRSQIDPAVRGELCRRHRAC